MKEAVVLLSGGLDSCVTLYKAREQNDRVHALSIVYGQIHKRELQSARDIVSISNTYSHKILDVPLDQVAISALLANSEGRISGEYKEIAKTWVPQRNTLFLTLAAAYAESIGATEVWTGVNAVDYSGYPDCRPTFISALEAALNLGSARFVENSIPLRLKTPLIDLTKVQIIHEGLRLNVPFELTWSCYTGGDKPCLECDSCKIRQDAFDRAGLKDPALVA